MTLIEQKNGDGKITGCCDTRCYDAEHPQCECVCGGRNHGVGRMQAIENTKEIIKEKIAEGDFRIITPVASLLGQIELF